MQRKLADLMTPDPVTLPHTATLVEAAEQMARSDIGDVVIEEKGTVCGLVTDRDIVVRGLAQGMDPNSTTLADICQHTLICLTPDDAPEEAMRQMKEHAIRRIPIVEGGRAVGVVSLGDLAQDRDRDVDATLAAISAAPSNG
jgi:CBS domain-containing protein